MKNTLPILFLLISVLTFSQTDIIKNYNKADSLLESNNNFEAYNIYKNIEAKCDSADTLYSYIVWYYTTAVTRLEKENRMNQNFETSLQYGLEAMDLIEKGKAFYYNNFTAREYWMHKNLIVSYFGLGQIDNALKHKEILYQAYKDKNLPEGIDSYFNFTFFKHKGNNIWGYEWYPELGEPETKGSFSKIVYYVYNTNSDGSDKDQLYRLHVLKFHKLNKKVKIDYILTKRLETATDEVSGTLYSYTYTKDIDYNKLQKDIIEVLNGNYESGVKSKSKKKKN